jgi:nicotinamide riboside kinase
MHDNANGVEGEGAIGALSPSDATQEPSAAEVKAKKKLTTAAALKLVPKLVEAYTWNQDQRARGLALEIVDALEDVHPDVSKQLRRFTSTGLQPTRLHKPEKILDFETARFGFESLILAEKTLLEFRSIVNEHDRAGELRAFQLFPRHRILLHGAPGNGKTMLAEALAKELNVPFLRVKYGGLIDSHLGETAKNIDSLFDYAKSAPCVLFADEFDGIGMGRGDNQDVGEARRITNQLLITLERLPSHCVFVAATNSPELMDKALNRRFDVVLEIPKPTPELFAACARKELDPLITPGHDLLYLVPRIRNLDLENIFSVVELCKRIRRDLVLNEGRGIEHLLTHF